MNSSWILGSGPTSASLMIIGDSLSKSDEASGKNFVGSGGEILTELLSNAKFSRSSAYLTNVVKIRPPNGDIEKLSEIDVKVEDFLPLLWNEIEALQPNCILALGSLTLKILTGKEGIRNYRGSILPLHNFASGKQINRDIKVVPTIHPFAISDRTYGISSGEGMYSWKQKAHIQFDVIKAVRESAFSDFSSIPRRQLQVIRSSNALEQFFNLYKDYNKVYVDTEVFKSHLVCIGFAFTPYHGISVPLVDLQSDSNYKGIPLHELIDIWEVVADKLRDKNLLKAGQNFKGDKIYWLEPAGFEVNGFCDDAMFKIHTLSPELPKSQAFQASVFTNEPYYKSEGKEYNPYKDNIDDLLLYNAKDCVVNCECDQEMQKDLVELGLEEFYNSYVLDMMPIYEGMEKKGWKIDQVKRADLLKFYTDLLDKYNIEAEEMLKELGIEGKWNYNSPKQMEELIYVRMRCPQRKDTAEQTLTALMVNAVKDVRKKKVIDSVLIRRSLSKMISTYINAQVDLDDRMRWSYNQVGTETGRTSTQTIHKPQRNGIWGTGIQLIPRPDEFGGKIREMYVADKGKILFEMDQSQAEARIVALLANDLDLLALFDILPTLSKRKNEKFGGDSSWDVHKLTASFCYGLTERSGPELMTAAIQQFNNILNDIDFSFMDLVDEFQRDIGKAARHGLGYNLGEDGLSIKMKISRYRAKIAFEKVHQMSPNLVGVFHEQVQEALATNNRVLMTPFGRRREFFEEWSNKLFREAYAHIPQSTIGDNTKRAMKGISKIDWIEFLAETHDAFVAQIPEGRVEEAYHICKPIFEQPIDFERCTLSRPPITIPIDCKVGYNWGQMKKVRF